MSLFWDKRVTSPLSYTDLIASLFPGYIYSTNDDIFRHLKRVRVLFELILNLKICRKSKLPLLICGKAKDQFGCIPSKVHIFFLLSYFRSVSGKDGSSVENR